MTGIKFDADWVGGYAKLAAKSAHALHEGKQTLAADPLTDESFGRLGKTVHSTQAYARVADRLRDQLSRAVEALHSASTSLDKVTEQYVGSDEDNAATITRGKS